MQIDTIKLNNFRNYSAAEVDFSSGVNFIVGKNAQGKTNLLESLYLLSVGKSPKNSKVSQIIKFNKDKARVEISFLTLAGKKNLSMLMDRQNKKYIKLNNLNILKLTELVGNLSVVYFSPDELKLVKEVPEDRRNFLDVSISQFDKVYLYNLIKYNKILKQRNAILKADLSADSKIEQLSLFTPQLIIIAADIILTRLNFINNLSPIAKQIHKKITDDEILTLSYSFSLDGLENLSNEDKKQKIISYLTDIFNKNITKELELKYTLFGPHRDDIIFKINNLDCRQFSSQGQQRTVALVMKLSLMEVIRKEINEYPILLLDDVLSELDSVRQEKLLNMCTNYQTLITCTAVPKTEINFKKINVINGTIS